MLRFTTLATLLLATATSTAFAQSRQDYVTDPRMCSTSFDVRLGLGFIFDGQTLETTEYRCVLDRMITFAPTNDMMTTSATAYCEEPGFVEANLFVIRKLDSGNDIVELFQKGVDQPLVFFKCR